jgi:hypothetical protein
MKGRCGTILSSRMSRGRPLATGAEPASPSEKSARNHGEARAPVFTHSKTLATLLLAFCFGSIVGSWFLTQANGRSSLQAGMDALDSVVLYGVVGAVIAWRRPSHPMGWMFLAIGALWTSGRFADQYAQYTLVTHPGRFPGGTLAVWYGEWFWIPALFFTFVFTILLFPDGHIPSPRWRPFFWFALLSSGVFTVAAALERELELASQDLAVRNPVGLLPIDDVEDIAALPPLLAFVCALGALSSLVIRFRRSRGDDRQQLKWVAYAATLLVLGFIAMAVSDEFTGRRPPVVDALLFAVVPVAAGFAILKYRLYDIDRIINRTLVYGALTAVLAGVYALGVVVIPSVVGAGKRSDLLVAGSTLLVAALFQPARKRIQGFIDRRFYRGRYDAQRTVEAFGSRLRDEVRLDDVSTDLLGVVQGTLKPAHASLWLRPGAGL